MAFRLNIFTSNTNLHMWEDICSVVSLLEKTVSRSDEQAGRWSAFQRRYQRSSTRKIYVRYESHIKPRVWTRCRFDHRLIIWVTVSPKRPTLEELHAILVRPGGTMHGSLDAVQLLWIEYLYGKTILNWFVPFLCWHIFLYWNNELDAWSNPRYVFLALGFWQIWKKVNIAKA